MPPPPIRLRALSPPVGRGQRVHDPPWSPGQQRHRRPQRSHDVGGGSGTGPQTIRHFMRSAIEDAPAAEWNVSRSRMARAHRTSESLPSIAEAPDCAAMDDLGVSWGNTISAGSGVEEAEDGGSARPRARSWAFSMRSSIGCTLPNLRHRQAADPSASSFLGSTCADMLLVTAGLSEPPAPEIGSQASRNPRAPRAPPPTLGGSGPAAPSLTTTESWRRLRVRTG